MVEKVRLSKESILRFTIEAMLWKRKMFEDYTRRRKLLCKNVLVPLEYRKDKVLRPRKVPKLITVIRL